MVQQSKIISKNIVALDLNALWRTFLRQELKQFGLDHPESKFNIICWTDELVINSVQIINDYLVENECSSRLKKGAEIIGKSRTVFYDLTKKKVLF